MSDHIFKGFVGKGSALGTGRKAAVIAAASIVMVGGASLHVYPNHQTIKL